MPTNSPDSPLGRIAARLSAIPLNRLRRVLLVLYVLTALFDAAGKALAANPRINAAVRRVVGGSTAVELHRAARPHGNFEIFRTASRHLVTGDDLYAEYPQ